jgi:fructose-bisphosphate aldolase class I
MGARFAKWRAVIAVDHNLPSQENVRHECIHLAQYAKLCQDNGIVPMVEPEVLLKGDHSMERAADVTLATLMTLFRELEKADVDLSAVVLKTSMVLPGKEDPGGKDSPEEVAKETVDVLNVAVPQDLAGVVFLSGGQLPIEATENLNEISKIKTPWPTTFSYARAIQAPAMKIWNGNDDHLEVAREEFLKRLKLNTLASKGEYNGDME